MRYQSPGEFKLVSLKGVGESKVVALRASVNLNWSLRQARLREMVVVFGARESEVLPFELVRCFSCAR